MSSTTTKTFILQPGKGRFKGVGDHPPRHHRIRDRPASSHGDPDPARDELQGSPGKRKAAARTLEGEWHFVAKVPRDPKEAFPEPFHVTQPVKVQVQERPLRVLLFAGGATREYQFLRTVIYRETIEKRMEMSILLQSGKDIDIDQDVDVERMLLEFPAKIGPNDPGQKFMSLSDYDVIIAFDPDWSKLLPKLNSPPCASWVGTHARRRRLQMAGPVFTHQVARKEGRDIDALLLSIYPVWLQDNRLHGLGVAGGGLGHDTPPAPTRSDSRPHGAGKKQYDFLKLDETAESPTAGWNGYFYNNEKFKVDASNKDLFPRRGIFSYCPVEKLKPASAVAAGLPNVVKEARHLRQNRSVQGPATVPRLHATYGGRQEPTIYLGSGEFWRLRSFKDGYFERMWIKMARFVAAGATQTGKIMAASSWHATFRLARSASRPR